MPKLHGLNDTADAQEKAAQAAAQADVILSPSMCRLHADAAATRVEAFMADMK